jgi:hypothetical protein
MKLAIFVIFFFLIGAFFIISENKLALKDEEARKEFSSLYLDWFSRLFENSKFLAGYVIELDWLPQNRSEG